MTIDTLANDLMKRLDYWECELEIEACASPDPVARLDHIIDSIITDETRLMEDFSAVKRENKRLRYRWTSLRKLLGIEQKQEERWE